MKKKIFAFLRNKSGEGYVDLLIGLMVVLVIAAMMVMFYPLFSMSQELNQTARQAARVAEVTGQIGSEVEDVLYHSVNMAPDTDEWTVEYHDVNDQTIQLKDTFSVVLTKKVPITIIQPVFSEPLQFYITISANASGVSEVYWK